MTTRIDRILNQLPNDSSSDNVPNRLSINAVDALADELVKEYSNPVFRKWYCGVVNDFGYAQVNEWRNRSRSGKYPAKLFSKYVKDSRTHRGSMSVQI